MTVPPPKKKPTENESKPSADVEKLVAASVASIEKAFGKGTVMRLGDTRAAQIRKEDVISTGSLGLDIAIGVGGIPRGRIVEIFGPESCLAGDSFLQFEVWSIEGERINHKGGSIKRLYERFHNCVVNGEPNQGRHLQRKHGIEFFVKAVDDTGRIIRNQILDVVYTGKKVCYKIETDNGQQLLSTPEHKYLTPTGYKPLSELKPGDQVLVHNNTRVTGRQQHSTRPTICVKYHPNLPTKIVHDTKTGNDYLYYRGQTSRLVYEAFMNEMSFDSYKNLLNEGTKAEIQKLRFLPNSVHVHHKDENFTNDDINNLQLIDPSEHGKLHTKDRIRNLSFIAVTATITNITEDCVYDTYDLRCEYPYNNYIAEGFVVHNSGKTTLALHVIAHAQKTGGVCAYIDAEHALDTSYARNLGVDVDNLLVSQPDGGGEQALEIVDQFVRGGGITVVVVDSVAALTPRAELEGEMGESHMGLMARLMSQAMRKLTSSVSRSNTLVIFINQTRQKIGVMWGSNETTTGGMALKFYASLRFEIKRIGALKVGAAEDATIIGNKTVVRVVKNKLAAPFRKAEFDIIYGKGISFESEVIDLGVLHGIIEKSGAWYSYGEERLSQGRENTREFLVEVPKLTKDIANKIKAAGYKEVKNKTNG